MAMHRIARADDIPPGSGLGVEAGGRRIAVFNAGGTFYAIDDECPHSGAPLSEGDVSGTEVECPWHSAVFDLCDGSVKCPPAEEDVRCYPVQVVDGNVMVEID